MGFQPARHHERRAHLRAEPGRRGTRLDQSENFRGLLVPFSGKILARAEAGFRALNEAVKKRAEAS